MKLVAFVVLFAVVVGGLVGTLVVKDPGYVLVSYADTVVETSLWVALFLIFLLMASLWALGYLMRSVNQGQRGVVRFLSGRKIRTARSQTVRGLLVMAEGRWQEARKMLLDAAPKAETPLINYLNAARSAHELGEREDRDQQLKRAHESTPGAQFAVTLTQAEFNIDDGQHEQALAALLRLRKRAPKHSAVLNMLAQCYRALEDAEALSELMSDLRKSKAVSEEEFSDLEAWIWRTRLQKDAQSDNKVGAAWKRLPKHLRTDESVLLPWVDALIAAPSHQAAEEAIRTSLANTWSGVLARRYGLLDDADAAQQLLVARKWHKERPNDADVALTLGRLCLRTGEFEQAREYLETSLRLDSRTETYGELGRLCYALGDEQRGLEYLLRAQDNLPDLPLPSAPTMRRATV